MAQKILIVEDNEKNRKLARDILQYHGFDILEADNAESGIEIANRESPALILMDFHLPGMNGIEALAALRSGEATRGIPVMAVTASAMTEERVKIIAAGFDGLQTKPIHLKEFVEAVKILAAKGSAR